MQLVRPVARLKKALRWYDREVVRRIGGEPRHHRVELDERLLDDCGPLLDGPVAILQGGQEPRPGAGGVRPVRIGKS